MTTPLALGVLAAGLGGIYAALAVRKGRKK